MDFPTRIPLFPLPNVVLFPGVPLPLHIFEPRYREMVRDASSGHEIIGMVLLRGDWQKDYNEQPQVFDTGCAGRIVNVEPLRDGRFNIVLHGLREFSIRREVAGKPYRQAEVAWRSGVTGTLPAADRQRLTQLLCRLLQATPDSPAHNLLRDETLSDDLLVNFFSYALDIDPLEKQGLLHEETLTARGARLREIIEFRLEEARFGCARSATDRRH